MTSVDIAVLGAGPAGLAAALRLAESGRRVVVLERARQVGGLTASFEVGGQRVDVGSHRLHPSIEPEMLALLRSLLGDELQLRKRNGRIRLFDQWLAFPLSSGNLLRSMPPSFLVRATGSALLATTRPRREATFNDYVTTGLGRVMGEEFYFPYARKIWGLSADELSGAQARRRISADSPLRLLRKVLRPAAAEGFGPGRFLYPAGGFGRIAEVLADAATESGAEIRLGNAVAGVRLTPNDATVTTADGTVAAGTVLSTLPVTTLAALLQPTGPPAASLEFRAMVVVYVVIDAPSYTPFDAHYLPGPSTRITRVSEPKNYRDATPSWPDPPDTTVLCAEIPCRLGDDVWESGEGELTERVIEGLVVNGLPRPRVLETSVLRQPQAYPIYRVGQEAVLEPVLDDLATRPRLVSFGRQGLFAHDNTHHALAMAQAAAAAVRPDGTVDLAAWAAALDRFAGHVVED